MRTRNLLLVHSKAARRMSESVYFAFSSPDLWSLRRSSSALSKVYRRFGSRL